jgi:glycosyltransferase involved in cell wall biosynthesis
LNIYPAIQRDATAYNWKRKRQIFARSQFYVATPSEWLMRKVKQSILAPAILEARVIPNGVDTSVFRPGEPEAARASLGIPRNCRMLLFTANKIRRNVWKDYETMKNAITRIGRDSGAAPIIFVALGEEAPTERVGYAELQFVPYQNDTAKVAAYYQAADLYIHAARADTFPNTVLEALACGTPVVATAVGGIPEQIKGLSLEYQQSALKDLNQHGPDEATGAVVPMGDADAMADTITRLVDDEILLRRLSANAVRDVRQRFDLSRQIENYLNWYKQLVKVSA